MEIGGKKQLTIIMDCTVPYANEQSTANNPIAVAFVNWINSHDMKNIRQEDNYMVLNGN